MVHVWVRRKKMSLFGSLPSIIPRINGYEITSLLEHVCHNFSSRATALWKINPNNIIVVAVKSTTTLPYFMYFPWSRSILTAQHYFRCKYWQNTGKIFFLMWEESKYLISNVIDWKKCYKGYPLHQWYHSLQSHSGIIAIFRYAPHTWTGL